MPEDLTRREKLMDTNNDNRVSKEERRAFREGALETVAGMGGDKWALSYALVTQLGKSDDPDAQAMFRWLESKAQEYFRNPVGFSDQAYVREFNAQPWAQKYKSTAIRDMDFEAQFPDLYKDTIKFDVEILRDQAAQYGSVLTDDELAELAKQKRRFSWNASQVQNALADFATAKGGNFRGAAGTTQNNLRDWARRNGVALTDNTINNYVQRVTAGDMSEADVLQDLRRTYISGAYPGWSDRIEAGQDIADIAEPYRQTMARILELPEDQIDLNDSLLRRGLQSVGPDGKPRVMPLYEFEQEIRKDPRWEFTENAYDVYSRVGTNLLRTFGFR